MRSLGQRVQNSRRGDYAANVRGITENKYKTSQLGCYECWELGHLAKDCPTKKETSKVVGCPTKKKCKANQVGCFGSGELGHLAKNCPTKKECKAVVCPTKKKCKAGQLKMF